MLSNHLTKVLLATLFIQQVFGTFWLVNVDKKPTVNDEKWITFHFFDTFKTFDQEVCAFNKMFKTTITEEQDDFSTCGTNNPSIAVVAGENNVLTGLKVSKSDDVYPCVLINKDASFDSYTCGKYIPVKN
ncbi:hypothetical protein BJ944DRAFT_245495 [Cunninghamella echinulata]|nr:hypothetical protein BJ944DRAFT_245495 [Cunninghamella echinulata]